jgi:hypothetical protein
MSLYFVGKYRYFPVFQEENSRRKTVPANFFVHYSLETFIFFRKIALKKSLLLMLVENSQPTGALCSKGCNGIQDSRKYM